MAGLLSEQAAVDLDLGTATIALGATKTDVRGQGCRRTLRCSCGTGSSSSTGGTALGRAMCPVHALARIRARAMARGCSAKHPLIPGSGGKALSAAAARRLLRAATGAPLTEHSLRRMGAQLYARRGVPLPLVQFLGRWGSAAIEKYVGEALAGRASWAPLAAAADFDAADLVGSCAGGAAAPGLGQLASWIKDVVLKEIDAQGRRAAAGRDGPRKGRRPAARRIAADGATAHGGKAAAGVEAAPEAAGDRAAATEVEAQRSECGREAKLGAPGVAAATGIASADTGAAAVAASGGVGWRWGRVGVPQDSRGHAWHEANGPCGYPLHSHGDRAHG